MIKYFTYKKQIIVFFLSVILLGCQTTDPYTGDKKTNKTAVYGGLGALAGAVVGGLMDGGKGALKGAVILGSAGAGYGYYVNQQEKELRKVLVGSGVQVSRDNDKLTLIMPANITFATNQSDIRSSFYTVLKSVVLVLKQFDKTFIQIDGYTDSSGTDRINRPLSLKRARSVGEFFSSQGVNAQRIQMRGMGSSNPIASNRTKEGRSLNRRVEIHLTQMKLD